MEVIRVRLPDLYATSPTITETRHLNVARADDIIDYYVDSF